MSIEEAPKYLRSWAAMWVLTLTPIVFYSLAGADVGKFYSLWEMGADKLLGIVGVLMGIKFGKDTLMRSNELKANVAAGVAEPTKITYSKTGSD